MPANEQSAAAADNQEARGVRLSRHREFLLALRRRPAAAVCLVVVFMVLGVIVVALPSHGSAKFWHPAMAWTTGALAIGVAAYLTAAVYLVQGDQAGEENGESASDRVKLAQEAARDVPAVGSVTGPVLALDVDGVLHMGQSGRLNKLPLLQQWLYEHPSVQVVISSDWRYTHGFAQVRDLFDEELRDRVIGATPVHEGAPREEEILSVVRRCGIEVWAALDDVEAGFPTTAREHLVRTNPLFGLSESDLAVLAERLGV